MNTIMFLAGLGVGMTVSAVFMLVCISRIGNTAQKDNKAHLSITEELLKERNKANNKIALHLERMAEWCEANWKL